MKRASNLIRSVGSVENLSDWFTNNGNRPMKDNLKTKSDFGREK